MFRNYIAAALRNLTRNKLVSAINIGGLALGIAAALLIALYIRHQLSFEDFLPGNEQVYRLSLTLQRPGNTPEIWDTADYFMAERLKMDYPEVAMTARIIGQFPGVRRGNLEFQELVHFADPDFFRMLSFPVLKGDPAAALDSPDGLVITRTVARKYFGDRDAVGQSLEFNRDSMMRVVAVIEDLPGNTHFNFRMVASAKAKFSGMSFIETSRNLTDVFVPGAHTYFRLRDGADPARISADGQNFIQKHYAQSLGNTARLDIHALSRVHLSPPGRWPMTPAVNPRTLLSMGLVGFLVILIAAINFINMMTARAAQRAVEVGVRKSLGARRVDLIAQFLGEACLYVLAAALIAVAFVELALPAFNTMLSTGDDMDQPARLTFEYWREPRIAGALLLATLLLSLLAGAYPAFVMSAMRPANAIHRGVTASAAARVRRWLVVMQLAILIVLLFATVVVHRQTTFAMNEALRIAYDQVLLVFYSDSTPTDAFRESIERIPGVSGLTAAAAAPTNYDISAAHFSHEGGERVFLQISAVDFNFFEFFGLQPLAGRLPSRARGTDLFADGDGTHHVSVWLNESAARVLGINSPAAAIGEKLTPFWRMQGPPPASITIAGVVPDFLIDSVRGPIQPVMYYVKPEFSRIMSIRLRGEQIPETLAAIDDVWKRLGEPRPISRLFLEQYHHRQYIDIIQQRRVLGSLSGVAVFLACLGLFGLSIYTAQRRTKEIGVRKVMGAGTADIMRMLLWAFSKPVFWASLIAWPLAAWLMHQWLAGFVYRVPLGWWWLPVASLVALFVALLTVSVHSYAVARQQPAGALRYE